MRRGELHAAAATVHGGGTALVVARASKRAARTSGAQARVWVNGEGQSTRRIDMEGSERRRESRTRAPSRLSRMWTALLARLGEISIVLHAG